MTNSLSRAVVLIFIYAILGWICEVIYCSVPAKKFINRGFLYGPYCPIYGFGAFLILQILAPFHQSLVAVFILGIILTSVLEYVTSYIMELLFDMKWWDYSQRPFNLNGRICLKNSILFGLLSVVLVFIVHPPIHELLSMLHKTQFMVLYYVIIIMVGIDIVMTVENLLDLKEKMDLFVSELEIVAAENPLNLEELEQSLYAYADTQKEKDDVTALVKDLNVFLNNRKFIRYFRAFPTVTNKRYAHTFDLIRRDFIEPIHRKNLQNMSIIRYQFERMKRYMRKEMYYAKIDFPYSLVRLLWFVLIAGFVGMLIRYTFSAVVARTIIIDGDTVRYLYKTSVSMAVAMIFFLPIRHGRLLPQFFLSGFTGVIVDGLFSEFFTRGLEPDIRLFHAITSHVALFILWGFLGVFMLRIIWPRISSWAKKQKNQKIYPMTIALIILYIIYSVMWHSSIFS